MKLVVRRVGLKMSARDVCLRFICLNTLGTYYAASESMNLQIASWLRKTRAQKSFGSSPIGPSLTFSSWLQVYQEDRQSLCQKCVQSLQKAMHASQLQHSTVSLGSNSCQQGHEAKVSVIVCLPSHFEWFLCTLWLQRWAIRLCKALQATSWTKLSNLLWPAWLQPRQPFL